jgi:hypothetical protein
MASSCARWAPAPAAQPAAGLGRALCLLTVLIASFGRAISEVGAVMIVGGNIDGFTRVMTTAIALETSKGDLPLAWAWAWCCWPWCWLLNVLIALRCGAGASGWTGRRRAPLHGWQWRGPAPWWPGLWICAPLDRVFCVGGVCRRCRVCCGRAG